MSTIIPAIIPQSLEQLDETLESLASVVSAFQIDIVDGVFVPFTSWPYVTNEPPSSINAHIENFDIEFDLMIREPENSIDDWLLTSAKRFIIHVESTKDIERCITLVKEAGKQVGLALNNDTELSVLKPFLNDIDFIQCMGIAEIGRQGNAFDERVLERVQRIKEFHPEMEISVDGSVNEDTIERIHAAGATRLVSGSAILRAESPLGAYNALLKQIS